jgi:hypothetical protein
MGRSAGRIADSPSSVVEARPMIALPLSNETRRHVLDSVVPSTHPA